MTRVDVAILGAGTAGAAVANQCAKRGLSVVALDRGPLEKAGAHWVNGVPLWSFEEADVAPPEGDECLNADSLFHVVAGWGPHRATVVGGLEVDMRQLVQRLQAGAVEAGATFRGGVHVQAVEGNIVRTDGDDVQADVIVDATGWNGLHLLGQPDDIDLCVAAQEMRTISDMDGAKAWLRAQRAHDGEAVCFSGVEGGYSIVNIRIHGDHVGILTGPIPARGVPAGTKMLQTFVQDNPWVGERVFGGSRAIPIGRPADVVGRGHIAAVGDSVNQVYPAHGSGIAQQLLAAHDLADAIVSGGGPAAYNVVWQRGRGGILAGADVFRRFSETMDVSDLEGLILGKVMSPPLMRDVMTQRPSRPPARALARALPGIARRPRLLRRVAPVIARMRAVEWMYRRYPADPSKVGTWSRRVRRLAGLPSA